MSLADHRGAAAELWPKRLETKIKFNFICCGDDHVAAISERNGRNLLYVWGKNDCGQLGLGDFRHRSVPTLLNLEERIAFVSCGPSQLYVVTISDHVLAAGRGDHGQLGLEECPKKVPNLCEVESLQGCGIVTVDVGELHAIARSSFGECLTFGQGPDGQLGIGDDPVEHPEDVFLPTHLDFLKSSVSCSAACGAVCSFAALETNQVMAWGEGAYGKLGLADEWNRAYPTLIPALDGIRITKVACGSDHTIALAEKGDLFVWGHNTYGQLGTGIFEDVPTPQKLTFPDDPEPPDPNNPYAEVLPKRLVKDIACGAYHTMVVRTLDGKDEIWGWGRGEHGQVGCGVAGKQPVPKQVKTFPSKELVKQLACGANFTMALSEKGNLYSWGRDIYGQLGHGRYEPKEESVFSRKKRTIETEDVIHRLAKGKGGETMKLRKNRSESPFLITRSKTPNLQSKLHALDHYIANDAPQDQYEDKNRSHWWRTAMGATHPGRRADPLIKRSRPGAANPPSLSGSQSVHSSLGASAVRRKGSVAGSGAVGQTVVANNAKVMTPDPKATRGVGRGQPTQKPQKEPEWLKFGL
eukprot:Rmarinus@m.27727